MIIKWLCIFACILFSSFSLPTSIHATTGSISLTLEDSEYTTNKEGVVFGLTKVAELIDGKYQTIKGNGIDEIDFNSITTAAQVQKISKQIENRVKIEHRYQTDHEGSMMIQDIPIGLYFLQCLDHQSYDQILPSLISVPTYTNETSNMIYDIKIIPKHIPNRNLKLQKIDAHTKKPIVSDVAKFSLYQDKECTKRLDSKSTNKTDGSVSFEQLPITQLYLREEKAPKGYVKSNKLYRFDLREDGIYFEDEKLALQDGYYVYNIENQKVDKVPTMDQSQRYVWMFLCISMIPCLFLYARKRKSEK